MDEMELETGSVSIASGTIIDPYVIYGQNLDD